ncbi:hypothetical protein ACLB2K_050275 [Fragaria x ananassa]
MSKCEECILITMTKHKVLSQSIVDVSMLMEAFIVLTTQPFSLSLIADINCHVMLYQKAKLVHTYLSEFNIVYFEGHLYIIDVSQAVEISHSDANEFLCQDCVHVSLIQVLLRKQWTVIWMRYIKKLRTEEDISVTDEIAESVFVQVTRLHTLDQVMNDEEDVLRSTSGEDTEDVN